MSVKKSFVLEPDGLLLFPHSWKEKTKSTALNEQWICQMDLASQPRSGGSMVEIEFRLPEIVCGKTPNNELIRFRTKGRQIPF